MPLGAIAHAELKSEIDTEADKQYGKIDRDQIERADHDQAERGGDGKPDDKADEYRENDAHPAQRQPQNEEHDRDRHRGIERGILLDRGEFLVGHRHRAGQTQSRMIFGGDIEIGGRLANGVGRPLPGLELRVVERRLDFDEAQQIIGGRGVALDQFVPGKIRRLAGIHLLDRIGRRDSSARSCCRA